jgi:hypothetical protein
MLQGLVAQITPRYVAKLTQLPWDCNWRVNRNKNHDRHLDTAKFDGE